MDIGADGLKTGFTKEAGYGLVGSAVQNGLRLIVVVNGSRPRRSAPTKRKKLLEWGFRVSRRASLFAEGETVGEAKVFGGAKGHVPLVGPAADPADGAARRARAAHRARSSTPARCRRRSRRASRSACCKVWRGDSRGARSAAAGGRGRRQRQPARSAPSTRSSELVIGLFRAGVSGYRLR